MSCSNGREILEGFTRLGACYKPAWTAEDVGQPCGQPQGMQAQKVPQVWESVTKLHGQRRMSPWLSMWLCYVLPGLCNPRRFQATTSSHSALLLETACATGLQVTVKNNFYTTQNSTHTGQDSSGQQAAEFTLT